MIRRVRRTCQGPRGREIIPIPAGVHELSPALSFATQLIAERPPGRSEQGDALPGERPPKLAWEGFKGSSSIPRMETIPDTDALALIPMGRPSDDLEPVIEMIASWSDSFSQRVLLIVVSGCHAILLLGSESERM
jgi:hypothetical protein